MKAKAVSVANGRIYVAGPMSGLPEFNYPAFNAAASRLRSEGYQVENPANNPAPACGTWRGYMRMALQQMLKCDRIHLLPGWEKSRGAMFEKLTAETLGMTITFEPEEPVVAP